MSMHTYRDVGGTTPWMGEVEPRREQRSRATQEAKAEERERETAWFPWSTVGIYTSDYLLAPYAFPRTPTGM